MTKVERISWSEMDSIIAEEIEEYQKIKSGVHIALLGTTRGGKTTLATGGGNPERGILRHFEDVLVLDTTGDPGKISQYGRPLQKFGRISGHRRLTVNNMRTETKEKVYRAIVRAIRQGNVAIYVDELRQMVDKKFFGMGPLLDHVWLFEAKKGNSLIGGSQAPRWLPGAFYDQSKIHIVFGVRDERTQKRLGEIGGDTRTIQSVVTTLKKFEFAHIGPYDERIRISKFALTIPRKVAQVNRDAEPKLSVYRD